MKGNEDTKNVNSNINNIANFKKENTSAIDRRKIAIFLVGMGVEAAADVFKVLPDHIVYDLVTEISKLDFIDPQEQEQILKEFAAVINASEASQFVNGESYARKIIQEAFGNRAEEILRKMENAGLFDPNRFTDGRSPFDSLSSVSEQNLVNYLKNEHPQVIALVLSQVDPKKSGAVLLSLSKEKQSEVIRRIITLDNIRPDMIASVETIFNDLSFNNKETEKFSGVDNVVQMLNFIDRNTERIILEDLDKNYPNISETIRSKLFSFEDLINLEDSAIQIILREVEVQDLAVALKGMGEDFMVKMQQNMSKRAGEILQSEYELIGPIRKKTVDEKQQKILDIVRRLEEEGIITTSRAGSGDELVL